MFKGIRMMEHLIKGVCIEIFFNRLVVSVTFYITLHCHKFISLVDIL